MASSASAATDNDDFDLGAAEAERLALDKLKGMSIEGVLAAGHEATIRLLSARAIAGTASHQELAILRNVLRDNGQVMGKVLDGTANKPLALPEGHEDIPELDAPDYQ